jgi:hypothetical protein
MDPIVEFYRGGPDHAGRTLEEILAWSHDQLERTHDYIQWLFPTTAPSRYNASAPLVTEATKEAFQAQPTLRQKLAHASLRMWFFYDVPGKPFWVTRSNHNFLRITRIITSLRELGLSEEAHSFLARMRTIYLAHANDQTPLIFWEQAALG